MSLIAAIDQELKFNSNVFLILVISMLAKRLVVSFTVSALTKAMEPAVIFVVANCGQSSFLSLPMFSLITNAGAHQDQGHPAEIHDQSVIS